MPILRLAHERHADPQGRTRARTLRRRGYRDERRPRLLRHWANR